MLESIVYFFIFETRGRTLENVNDLFDKNNMLHETETASSEAGKENSLDRSSAEKNAAELLVNTEVQEIPK